MLEEEATEINVTSLVDVVFNLLLFFMVTTTFTGAMGIKVNLPVASQPSLQESGKDIQVTIDAAGKVFVGDKQTDPDALRVEFLRLLQQGANSSLVIRADAAVHHGLVVRVMDTAKEAGIQKLSIAANVKS